MCVYNIKLTLRNFNRLLDNEPVDTFSARRCSQRAVIVVNLSEVDLLQESAEVEWTHIFIFVSLSVRGLLGLNFVKIEVIKLGVGIYLKQDTNHSGWF